MGLIIERHPSDAIRTSKIRITIDKKIKHKLSPGDKVEINIKKGLHRIDCSLNLLKSSMEIQYPQDNHIVISYRFSPVGINIKKVSAEEKSIASTDNFEFCCSSAMNGNVGKLAISDTELNFKEIGKKPITFNYFDIRNVNKSLGNLAIHLYTDESYTFILPKEKSDSILAFVKNKVQKCFQELHDGFTLCFGSDALIFVNEKDETFYIQEGNWISPIYTLEQIITYNVDEVSTKQNFVGDAALGSLIDGERGALFGVLHAAQRSKKIEAVRINLTIKTDKNVIALCLNFATPLFAVEKGSKKYDEAISQCLRFIAFMDDYKRRKSKLCSKDEYPKNNISNNIDVAEELRKYKTLFDDGIIDEDEFKAKKKKLLNI